jgi:hypothetical protein
VALDISGNLPAFELGSCDGLDDWFHFTVPDNHGLRVSLLQESQDADLDLYLLKAGESVSPVLAYAASLDPEEILQKTVLKGDQNVDLLVRNYGTVVNGQASPVPTNYTLVVELLPVAECRPDVLEDNDTEATAKTLSATFPLLFRGPLTACQADPDFYTFTVPSPGTDTIVRLEVDTAEGALNAQISELNQTAALGTSVYSNGYQTITFASEASKSYVLRVDATGDGPGVDYFVELLRGGFCTDSDDVVASNDTPDTAATVGEGYTFGVICERNVDYLQFQTPRAGNAIVELYQVNLFGDLEATVSIAGAENSLAAFGTADPTTGARTATFSATAGQTYMVRLAQPEGVGLTQYAVGVRGLAFCLEDAYEDNDLPQTATAVQSLTTDLPTVCGNTDADYYTFTVLNSGTAQVSINHTRQPQLAAQLSSGEQWVAAEVAATANNMTLSFEADASLTYVLKVLGEAADTAAQYYVQVIPPVPPPPANDTCGGAIALSANQSVSGTTTDATSDVVAVDNLCTGYATAGPDVVYTVNIPADGRLTANLNSEADLALYLVDACTSGCCWWGTDSYLAGREEVLQYWNSTTAEQTLFLVVDGETDAGAFTLAVDIQ